MNKGIKKHRMQGKTHSHRDALVRSLILDLVVSEKLKTTPSKAKIIKAEFDRLVTHAKRKTVSGQQVIQSFFNSNERAMQRFYTVVETKCQDRDSGYTRVIKTLPRKGDNADQAYIMLVNYSEKVKKSEVEKMLGQRKKKEESKSVAGRVKKAVSKVTKTAKK
ncbi:MAG: 50S ribosomal protein L17 [Candidatus Dojkabacteria bacterium]